MEANTQNYDGIDQIFFPSSPPYMSQQLHNGADSISDSGTPSSNDPSLNSSNSSPPQSIQYSSNLPIDEVGINSNDFPTFDLSSMTQPSATLQMLAQPKAFYRERYCSETDPNKHRAQRFIRADDETNKYEYPTVQIPSEWRDHHRDLYIRVTLVTIYSETAPVICIHPYAIDTQESDVLKNRSTNSLYFPIINEDILSSQKSFRISRTKMIQLDLRSYGYLHLFDSDGYDIQRVMNSDDAKQIIEIYQLWKSQLVFTIAERSDYSLLPVPINETSVTSQTMCDKASGRRNSLSNTSACTSIPEEDAAICVPRQGNWQGGDNILMVIPKLNIRKVCNIYFNYGSMGILSVIKVSYVDSKTIFFQSPPCQMLMADQNLIIPIIVNQNESIIARVDFLYLTSMRATTNVCPHCQLDMTYNNHTNNKRRHFILGPNEVDGAESLIQQMSELTTKEKPLEPDQKLHTNETNSKFDKYLGQLQEAVVGFVRTGNPSRLFRRTRLLLAKCDKNPPPLNDAIRHGHIEIALRLIEQVVDMSGPNDLLERENDDGETPLLLAAKLNYWNLIEAMLTKRLDLTEKTDKHGNTILHLLAGVSADAASATIENVLKILPDDLRINLLGKENDEKQLAMDIAQDKNNTQCVDLLKAS